MPHSNQIANARGDRTMSESTIEAEKEIEPV
jgi:hypothetical protein